MEDQSEPSEIPQTDEAENREEAPSPMTGELLPPESAPHEGDTGMALDFDDLPDPPGGAPFDAGDDNGRDSTPSLDAVYDVPVKVQAVLGRARMPIAELIAMNPGYVFELDRRVGEPIDILVNDRIIARGEIVMIDGSLGVTLTEIVKQDA
jgi:flagellar motor switch protein FliN